MAIDRETIASFYKKGENNSTIAKELQIRREKAWKVIMKFRKTGQTSIRPGQGRKRTVRTKRMVKTRGKSWRQIPVVRRPNWSQRLESARLRCAASLRRTSRPSPTRSPWAHTQEWTNEGRKMSTPSEPHGRWHAAQFGVLWREEVWHWAVSQLSKQPCLG